MQHKLFHISINATPNSSSSQFGMAVVGATKAGILLPSTGPNVTTKYKRLSGFAWQAFCYSAHAKLRFAIHGQDGGCIGGCAC